MVRFIKPDGSRARHPHLARAAFLLILAGISTFPGVSIIARIHHSNPPVTPQTASQAQVQQQQQAVVVAGTALQFERQQQQRSSYHAALRVHLDNTTVPTRLASALKAYTPPWVTWTDTPASSDILLQHAAGCAGFTPPAAASGVSLNKTFVRRQTQQHVVILQQGLSQCAGTGPGIHGQFLPQAVAAWQSALLVVSPSNIELQLQATTPSMQDSMRFWSMPWGANCSGVVGAQEGPGQNTTTSDLERFRHHPRLVLSFGGPSGEDGDALGALLKAAAQTRHFLLVLGPSAAADKLCQVGQQQQLARAQQRLCQSMHHAQKPLALAEYVGLVQAARYVAALHSEPVWQPELADAVLFKKRLILYNHTAPHAHYRWLRPFASVVEEAKDKPGQLTAQLVQVLSQRPASAKEFQHKDALTTFQWETLAPRLFERIWSELALARFPSSAQPSAGPAVPFTGPAATAVPSGQSRQLQAVIDAVTPVCAERSDDVLKWDAHLGRVVQTKVGDYVAQANLSCPSIIMLVSWWDRSIGVCQDAAQLAAHWGHVPLLPASILAMPVGQPAITQAVAAGRLPKTQLGATLKYHEFCAGSVIFSLSVAYSELVDVIKRDTTRPGEMPLHKYWFMPNYDVMNKFEVNSTVLLTKIADRLLCKTRACQSIMRAWLEHNYPTLPDMGEHDVLCTSFSTPDPVTGDDLPPADYTQFLHLMGKSPYKNTQPILEAWARNPDFPPLTVSTYDKDTIALVKQFLEGRRDLGYIPLNIRLVDTRMSVQQLNGLLRGIGIHVCPSQKEGFGHYINQARASEALVLTTDYPPMREFVGSNNEFGIACPYTHLFDMEVEMFSAVNNPYLPKLAAGFFPEDMAACIRRALALSVQSRRVYGSKARQRYLQEQQYFVSVLQALQQEADALVEAYRGAGNG